MIFHGIEGKDEREQSSPSWFNQDECAEVLSYVVEVLTTRRVSSAKDIGIIAPYRKQVKKIATLLQKSRELEQLRINAKDITVR